MGLCTPPMHSYYITINVISKLALLNFEWNIKLELVLSLVLLMLLFTEPKEFFKWLMKTGWSYRGSGCFMILKIQFLRF